MEEKKEDLQIQVPVPPKTQPAENNYSLLSVFLAVVITLGGLMLGTKILNDLKRVGQTGGEKILYESIFILPLIIITVIASVLFDKESKQKYANITIPYGIIMGWVTLKYLLVDILPVVYEMNKTLTIYISLILLVFVSTVLGLYIQKKYHENKD
jgi:L-asparagine transporter-like permease